MRKDLIIEYMIKNNINPHMYASVPFIDLDAREIFKALNIEKECCQTHLTTIRP
jgi:hypothetical protein